MTAPHPMTLRQLPFAAKLVLTCFLLAVGLGYVSAMVQLHMKHSSKQGEPLPTLDDVVEHFSGLKKPDDCPVQSRVETLIAGNIDEADVGKENMAPAFTTKSKGWQTLIAGRTRDRDVNVNKIHEEREGERQAMLAWVKANADEKKKAYEADRFPLPADLKGKPITQDYVADGAVKIRTLMDQRCQNCHKDQAPSLGNYDELATHVTIPSQELINGKWVRSTKQTSIESLTQSTHAHLLSFAVLFTLTGLTFAFSSYPGIIRAVLAPIVLVAQVTDVCCWWLARVPDYGPYFAMTIVATGTVVGLGLMLQIVLSIFNMYNWAGRAVMVLLFLIAGGAFGVLGMKVIKPALDEEKAAKTQQQQPKPKDEPKKNKETPPVKNGTAAKPVSQLERLIMAASDDPKLKWNGKEDGSMSAAFFQKDGGEFKRACKERSEPEVRAEREGERLAMQAWINAEPAARKKAYEEDKFTLPKELIGKPITPDYLHDDKTIVKVKLIMTDRCARCHSADGEQTDFPMETYEQIMKYIEPAKAAGK